MWVFLFSRTRWPRDHYDHAALLAAMNDVPLLGGLHCPQSKQGAAWAVLAWVALEMAWAAAGSWPPTADTKAMAVGLHGQGELPAFDDIDRLVLARLTLKGALL